MSKFFFFLFIAITPSALFSQTSSIRLEAKPIPRPATIDSSVLRWNNSFPLFNELPAQAKEALYYTNYCRLNPVKFWDSVVAPILAEFPPLNTPEAKSLKSDLQQAKPLPMFSLNEKLVKTAQAHADDIGKNKFKPGHNSTKGVDFGARMEKEGIKICAAENVTLSNEQIIMAVVMLYLDIGVPGLGHRKTLLDPRMVEIGVGSALWGKSQYFIVQDFACKQ